MSKMEENKKSPKDKYILYAFLGFFGTIFILDGIFVYTAISTQTGVVTERAYEKGLDYNKTLEQAKNQPQLKDKVTFDNKVLTWNLNDKNIQDAVVTAKIIRPIQDGYDFDIVLENKQNGIYEVILDLPLKGLWVAKLESQWNNKTYKTTHQFIVK